VWKAYKGYLNGIVQGVGMRFSVRTTATRKGLRGHVKNLPDGRVEIYFVGKEKDIERMIDLLRRNKIGAGHIDSVEGEWLDAPDDAPDSFDVKF